MLDIKLIREKPELVKENIKRRQNKEKLKLFDELIEADRKWRKVIADLNELQARRNKLSQEINKCKKEKKGVTKLLEEAKRIPERIKKLENERDKHAEKVKNVLMNLPNLMHESVPDGKDANDNVEIKRFGKKPEFDFEPKDHLTILQNLGMIDVERAAKVSGHGFFYLKGDVVLLDLALQRFAISNIVKKGYLLVEPPFMLNKKAFEGATDMENLKEQIFKIENDDKYLVGTAEHALAAMFMDEVLDKKDLPLKFVGVSPCFRKEVGTHGKYTKGLFRMHHFNKVEQFIFSSLEDSWKHFEELEKNSEELYQSLGLYCRVVNLCTGDLGSFSAKTFDTEIWMTDGNFREVGSCSNFTDYQPRRLNLKWREGPGKPPAGVIHTLNNTAFATSRTMVAIIEQNQQKDGSVIIPKVLVPFMNGIERLKKK
jgi:seryl-tRNA synthetase